MPIEELKGLLHKTYLNHQQAISDLGIKDIHDEGQGTRYPQKDLVRRVWFYGEPGTKVAMSDPGLAALAQLLLTRLSKMKKGFWSVVQEFMVEHSSPTQVDPYALEQYIKARPGWDTNGLVPLWIDILVEESDQQEDFPWAVVRDGRRLTFTRK